MIDQESTMLSTLQKVFKNTREKEKNIKRMDITFYVVYN